MYIDILILAVIAIYIAIKFYNIVGAEDVNDPVNKSQKSKIVINLESSEVKVKDIVKKTENSKEIKLVNNLPDNLKSQILKIKQIDANFSLEEFLNNTEKAFESIITAFTNADSETVNFLTDKKAQQNFSNNIAKIKDNKQKVAIDVVSFLRRELKDISINRNNCKITMHFTTEQIFFIEDEAGELVKGDRTKIEEIDDMWVFEKNLKDQSPVWRLIDAGN